MVLYVEAVHVNKWLKQLNFNFILFMQPELWDTDNKQSNSILEHFIKVGLHCSAAVHKNVQLLLWIITFINSLRPKCSFEHLRLKASELILAH